MRTISCEPYPELQAVLSRFVEGVQSALQSNFVGAYLVGSLATGDFDLDSDVDFLIVTKHDLSAAEVQSLQVLHSQIHELGCYPAKHLEGSYISEPILNRPDLVGVPLWYIDNGSKSLERSVHDNQWHVRWILRECSIALVGPDPKSLVPQVKAETLRAEIVTALQKLQSHFVSEIDQPLGWFRTRFGQSFTVLTCCRMLHTFRSGAVHSKLSSMRWAEKSLDPAWHELIRLAWTERKGVRFCLKVHQPADPKLLKETASFLAYVQGELSRNE